MKGISETSTPKTSEASPNATSSPGSGPGATPSASRDGLITGPSGPVRARVSLSARQAEREGLLTSGTYGRLGTTSSASAALAKSLENRLRARTASLGSTLFNLTWKRRVTPSGLSISALRGSVRRTSGRDSGSLLGTESPWATPLSRDFKGSPDTPRPKGRDLSFQAGLSHWPSPTASLADKGVRSEQGAIIEAARRNGADLAAMTSLASWPTPVATELGNTLENYLAMKKNMASGPRQAITHPSLAAQLAWWPTPQANNADRGGSLQRVENPDRSSDLHDAVLMCSHELPSGPARLTASGELRTGSSAGMGSGGQLNPDHSRWLMGLPAAWGSCGVTAMASLPKRRRKSSGRT